MTSCYVRRVYPGKIHTTKLNAESAVFICVNCLDAVFYCVNAILSFAKGRFFLCEFFGLCSQGRAEAVTVYKKFPSCRHEDWMRCQLIEIVLANAETDILPASPAP